MIGNSAYICDSIRTPIGRYGGALSSVRADDLAALPLRALVARNPDLDPKAIDDVFLGCANQAGEDNRNVARMAVLLSGLPKAVPAMTINRLCGSGLDAIGMAARSIGSGDMDVIIAGGVESMSRAPFVVAKPDKAFSRNAEMYDTTIGWRFVNATLEKQYGADPMPLTGENVAQEFNISRQDQDAFACLSQAKTKRAQDAGIFSEEIVPVTIPQRKGDNLVVSVDEHPRPETSLATLAKLRTPFKENGTITAGNASGVNDGAAAAIIASRAAIKQHQLKPIARIVTMATAGVAPNIMGIGPLPASKKALAKAGLKITDMDVIEINEAFASQSLAVMRGLGLGGDEGRVNPNGGAIALGHPLGMSGTRIVMAAARELKRRGGTYALCTMCIGVGQGIALVLEAC